jgi:glycopeptide antibiotics resistance protein
VGVFDVDDILMNSIGGIVGYIIFVIAYSLYKKNDKIKEEETSNMQEDGEERETV